MPIMTKRVDLKKLPRHLQHKTRRLIQNNEPRINILWSINITERSLDDEIRRLSGVRKDNQPVSRGQNAGRSYSRYGGGNTGVYSRS